MIEEEVERQINKIAEWLAQIDWEAVKRDLAAGPLELAKIGWFLTGNSPVSYHRRFLDMIRAGRAEECELELEKHYEEQLPSIRDLLFDQFPKRKAILEEAFKLHDEGRYVSAIPLFLIQSDGIGQSIFGASPISKGKKSREDLEKWINQRVVEGWALGRILALYPPNLTDQCRYQ